MAAATGSELQKMTLPVGLGEAGLGRGFLFYRLGVTVSGHPSGGAPLSRGLLSIGDSPHHHQALGESGMPRAGAGGRGSLWTGASLKGRSKLASAAPWAPRTPCPRGAHPGPPSAPYHLASGTAPTQQYQPRACLAPAAPGEQPRSCVESQGPHSHDATCTVVHSLWQPGGSPS